MVTRTKFSIIFAFCNYTFRFTEDKISTKNVLVELNGNILELLEDNKFDLLLVDLCDFRITERVFELENGQKLFLTNRDYNEQTETTIQEAIERTNGSKIKNINTVFVKLRDPYEVAHDINSFIELIYETIGREKVLFFCSCPIIQHLDNGEINQLADFINSGNTRYWLNQVFSKVKFDNEIFYFPDNLIGDSSFIKAFEFHYCKPYYEYLHNAILLKLKKGIITHEEIDNLLDLCTEKIRYLYNEVFSKSLIKNIELKKATSNIKPILISKSKYFAEFYKKIFNEEIYDYIYYDKDVNLEEIKKKITEIKRRETNSFFVMPELFYHGLEKSVQRVFYDINLINGKDYLIYSPPKKILPIKGYYKDIYGNEIFSQSLIKFAIYGCGNFVNIKSTSIKNTTIFIYNNYEIEIEEKCKSEGAKFSIFLNSSVKIGKNTVLNNCDIATHAFSHIEIGKDCLFSYNNMFYTGDGHAIYKVLDESGNCIRLNPPHNDSIKIGNHVWIEYRCSILGGTVIGDGSIIGAGSLVNKKFSNNVIIAGVPAKIIKKDCAWGAHHH